MTAGGRRLVFLCTLLMATVIVVTLHCAQEEPTELPTNPCARCAIKALRGDYGHLADWQRAGYTRIIDRGTRWARVWVTTYYPEEGFARGDATASGYGCSERVVAANRLPLHTFVWHPRTGLRQVLDRGAHGNDRRAQRLGVAFWIDWWEPNKGTICGDDNAGAQTVWIAR